jgi:mono/diheme cytochrome c family protein/peroxiredoxin
MNVARWALLLVSVFAVAMAAGIGAARWQATPVSPTKIASSSSSKRGAMLYTVHCAKCHGAEGHGDAEGVEKLVPPPRDFARRPWRFEPTAAAIERVVEQGIPGTAMPAFGATLLAPDIEALTEQVLALSASEDPATVEDDPFRRAKFNPIAPPRAAPSLTLQSMSGEKLSLYDLRGKVVLLNFWGVSCEHCLAKMPQLVEFQKQRGDGDLVVVNVCADEDNVDTAQQMLSQAAPSLTAHVDTTGLANGRYEVSLLPTLWLVNREGKLVAKAQGARDWNDPALGRLIDELLRQR